MFLSTESHVKIWFAQPPCWRSPDKPFHPLGGLLNELRLVRHRAFYPQHKIHLIVCRESLTIDEYDHISKFCIKYNIFLFDLTHIEKNTEGETEQFLLSMAREEIMQEFGCLAAASDLVRTLTFVLSLGIYTDFDYVFKEANENIPAKLSLKNNKGLLLNVGFNQYDIFDKIGTDFLAIIRPSDSDFRKKLQSGIADKYRNPSLVLVEVKRYFTNRILNLTRTKLQETGSNFLQIQQSLDKIRQASTGNDIFFIRRCMSKILSPELYYTYLLGQVTCMSGAWVFFDVLLNSSGNVSRRMQYGVESCGIPTNFTINISRY